MEAATRKRAAWLTIAVASVAGFEGLRTVAYKDPVGIPTICFGETVGVRMGDRASIEQCKDMLADSLSKADAAVMRCTRRPMTDERRAALVSFTYNVGGAAYCGSTVARKLNAGDVFGGCNELSRWVYARGVKLPGLVNRREEERKMCLKGLT